ncbi:hypothetical protein Sa4125_38740 [Aureimonas sp. SA4125]|uniref:c-type cytochrome n=1 Tax=Aureimonas sp. SA4125 TaxID=2826993 RepID=UPI001CC7993B|nr:cytochrome c [Aureimonas sp. SA4125]BDA86332.1 hypothetical protein Sa4125_38740 [Aureimonas sp. SA4125]
MNRTLLALAGTALLATTSLGSAQTAQAPAQIVPAAPAGAAAATATSPAAAPATPAATPAAPAAAPTAPAAAAPAAATATASAAPAAGGAMSIDSKENGMEATPGEEGKFVDSAGNPIYAKNADGTFDYYTWRGYKKYSANCFQCHGPDGLGSSFAPNLAEQLQRINYYDFTGIVVNGQQNKWHPVNSIMPAWGEDVNVMCFLDSIYVYLRGRADGAIPRGEPKKPALNKEAQAAENSCLGF